MRIVFILLCCLYLVGCQSNQVQIDFDTATNFAKFRTYQWLESNNSDEATNKSDPLLTRRVQSALAMELDKAGLRGVDQEEAADLQIRYFVTTTRQDQPSGARGGIGIGGGSRGTGVGLSISLPIGGSTSSSETEITVDLVSTTDQAVKWRGSKRLRLDNKTPEQITHLINGALAELFKDYPPQE